MRRIVFVLLILVIAGSLFVYIKQNFLSEKRIEKSNKEAAYWMLLKRKSNSEYLFWGVPGNIERSRIAKVFKVKTGIAGERPTPLPRLFGREYWLIIKKQNAADNPETAPYFLTLDIPAPNNWPFGPMPYEECGDSGEVGSKQCDWGMPGEFGLHGVNGDESRLSKADRGSSGCIRHEDGDITYLYNLFDPEKEKVRYYIEDI